MALATVPSRAFSCHKALDHEARICFGRTVTHRRSWIGSTAVRNAIVGVRQLDIFLSDNDVVAQEIEQAVSCRAGELDFRVVSVGIPDVFLT